ncbi:MAG: ABC transporter substrate-binding protein [Betaproteobacteria bacterium]|nr:ABC transporter substrate-binding protein [Betaproteobacteria bacterium]
MNTCGIRSIVSFSLVTLLAASAVSAADRLKIGVITTLSSGGAVLGEEVRNGAQLAVEMLKGRVGGLPSELVVLDDQMKPEAGREAAVELVKKHKVDFVVGMVWSNIVLAAVPYLAQEKMITLGTVGGPSELAGQKCSPYFFAFSNQTDQGGEAMGKHLQDTGVTDVAFLAPNYAAGRDILNGFKKYYKGKVVTEIFTKLGQPDYQGEITQVRAAGAKAVVAFYPGAMGIQFVQQYEQSGMRAKVPLYGIFVSDVMTLKAQRDAALGNYDVGYWNIDGTSARSQAFVAAYQAKFTKLPSLYSAATFDAINAIDEAVRATKGNLQDKAALIRNIERWNSSVRNSFAFNANHFPIQDYLLLQVVKTEKGDFVMKTAGVAFKDHKDSYVQDCKMPK